MHYLAVDPNRTDCLTPCDTQNVPRSRTTVNTTDVTCLLCLFHLGLYKPPHQVEPHVCQRITVRATE